MIKNVTRNRVVAKDYFLCNNFLSRSIGLMFADRIVPTVLAFSREKQASIHTCFVKMPIDVLFLGMNRKVVDLVNGLKPWNFYTPKKKAGFVVELPEGVIARTNTSVGDVLSLG